jgi:GAF domain-containing protein/anti-sigma regulatory factor (Ser/Thr protein kinase)
MAATSGTWAVAWFAGTFVRMNRRLYEESQRRTREQQTLLEMSGAVTSTLDLDQLYETALDRLAELIPYTGAAIQLNTPEGPWQVATRRPPGLQDEPVRHIRNWGQTSIVAELAQGRAVVIDDIRGDDPRAVEYRAVVGAPLEETPFRYFRSWMAVPLEVKGRVIGNLTVVQAEPAFFGDDHVALARSVANHVAIAIENARLFEERERKARELGALLELSRSVASTLDLHQLLEVAMDRLRELVSYTGGNISLRTEDGRAYSSLRRPGRDDSTVRRRPGWPDSKFMATLRSGSPVVIADLRGEEPLAVEYRSWLATSVEESPVAYVRSMLAVPLVAKGVSFGDVTLTHEEPAHFNEEHVELIQTVGNHLAIAIENARLFEDRERKTADLQALLEMSKVVTSTLDLQALFEGALDQLKSLIPYTGASLEVDSESGEMLVASRRPEGAAQGRVQRHSSWPRSSMIRDLRSGRAVLIEDVRGDDPRAVEYREALVMPIEETPLSWVRSLLAAPLVAKSGVIGNLVVTHSSPKFFTRDHVELASTVANHVAIAIENARLFEQAQRKTAELEGLLQAGERMHESLALADVLESVVEVAAGGMGLDFAALMLRDQEGGGLRVAAQRGFVPRSLAAAAATIAQLPPQPAEGGSAWAVPETLGQDNVNQELTVGLGMRSLVQIPIAYRGTNGIFMVGYREPHEWSADEVRLFQSLAQRGALAIENARLFEESQHRAREMAALYQADEKLFSSLDLDEVLKSLADIAVDVLGADKSLVSIADSTSGEFVPKAWRNLSAETLAFYTGGSRQHRSSPGLREGSMVVVEDMSQTHEEVRDLLTGEGLVASLDVPIVFDGRVSGAFGLGWTTRHEVTEEEKRLGEALAERAAVAIHNASLYARAQQAASLEERQRLARELHDSVSQALYGIALGARTARTQLDRDPAKVADPLDYVLSLAEAGLAEMRALIFELRPESLETEGLVAALDKQVAASRARHGLRVTAELGPEPDLSLDAKEAAYRIAQEALNNIAKHAQATSVSVRLEEGPGALTLTVQDDGRGFDTGQAFPGHMGLNSMRERAQKAGASLTIDSSPGKGSTIRVTFPKP